MENRDMEAKACSKCGEVKPLDEFATDRARPDGRRGVCRECRAGATPRKSEATPAVTTTEPMPAVTTTDAVATTEATPAATPTEATPAATSKVCGTCKVDKPMDEYPVDKARPDGHRSQCRPCMNGVDKARAERRKAEAGA